jgi:hypothetical protein
VWYHTGNKFITGVHDIGGHTLTRIFIDRLSNTSNKFITGAHHTGDNLLPVTTTPAII